MSQAGASVLENVSLFIKQTNQTNQRSRENILTKAKFIELLFVLRSDKSAPEAVSIHANSCMSSRVMLLSC